MEVGYLKWFSVDKGYGFITPENGGADVFVHISTLEHSGIKPDSLRGEKQGRPGQKVSYELTNNKNGRVSAKNLRLLQD